MTKAKKLRQKSQKDLLEMTESLTRDIFQMKNELSAVKKLDKPHRMRESKRERARILTILSEKKQSRRSKKPAAQGVSS